MTRKKMSFKVKEFRSSGGTSMSSDSATDIPPTFWKEVEKVHKLSSSDAASGYLYCSNLLYFTRCGLIVVPTTRDRWPSCRWWDMSLASVIGIRPI